MTEHSLTGFNYIQQKAGSDSECYANLQLLRLSGEHPSQHVNLLVGDTVILILWGKNEKGS